MDEIERFSLIFSGFKVKMNVNLKVLIFKLSCKGIGEPNKNKPMKRDANV